MRFIFVTNQFKTGGVETVFYNISSTTRRSLDLLPVHQNYDENLISRLPANVNLIKSGINPDRTIKGFLSIVKNAYKIKKELSGDEYVAINFSDTLSSLITAYILSGHNTISWMHISPSFLIKSKAYKLYVALLKKCGMLVFICYDQKKLFFDIIGHNTVKSNMCINYVNIKEIEIKSRKPFSCQDDYLFMAARLDERQKDFKTLFKAYSYLPDNIRNKYRLYIAGDGPDRENIQNQINTLKLQSNIELLGNVDNPYVWMKHCSVYVHASLAEGFPMSLVEALACGCNIVSADCPTGPSEILDRGKYGELYTVGDAIQLKDKILIALDKGKNPERSYKRAEEITQVGRKQIAEFFGGVQIK